MKEFQLIQALAKLRQPRPENLQVGIGDDCAVVRLDKREWLFSVDTFLEEVHFRRGLGNFNLWGEKLAIAALSDIAAMGGHPCYAMSELFLPKSFRQKNILDFYKGLLQILRPLKTPIIGGNISRSTKGFGASLIVMGERKPGVKMLRSSAKVGDLVYISGPVGLAAQALKHNRFYLPKSQLKLGQWLARHKIANACIDVSDGLWQDLEHIARASQVKILLEANRISHPSIPLKLALTGGEDYVLAFTAPRSKAKILMKKGLWPIGIVLKGKPEVIVLDHQGKKIRLRQKGWEHI